MIPGEAAIDGHVHRPLPVLRHSVDRSDTISHLVVVRVCDKSLIGHRHGLDGNHPKRGEPGGEANGKVAYVRVTRSASRPERASRPGTSARRVRGHAFLQ